MSRSFKKNPGFSDNGHGNNMHKKYANRKVRRAKIVGNYGNYKKLYEQYKIRDYNFRWYSSKDFFNYIKNYWNDFKGLLRKFYNGFSK
jgi:hypothetical protein